MDILNSLVDRTRQTLLGPSAPSANEGCNYLGLKLDDPSFNAPIYANFVDVEDGGMTDASKLGPG